MRQSSEEHDRGGLDGQRRQASKQGNTATEKEEMLSHESFPPNNNVQYYELLPV